MLVYQGTKAVWIPAFAGMTMVGSKRLRELDTSLQFLCQRLNVTSDKKKGFRKHGSLTFY
jgi:hypothetical protein